jgi:hypothetical protein
MIDFPKRHRVPYEGRFSVGSVSCEPPKGTPSKDALEIELGELSTGSPSFSSACSPTSDLPC